jgi:hypothetical protein
MNAVLLIQALAGFLRETIADYAAARAANGDFREPVVYEWALPFKNPKAGIDIDFPYVVVAPSEGQDMDAQSTVAVDLLFGVYQEGAERNGHTHPDGVYDLMNLMEHVRTALFRKRLINSRFELIKPYKWQIPREQPYPLWVGQAQSIWVVAAPLSQLVEGDIHGLKF